MVSENPDKSKTVEIIYIHYETIKNAGKRVTRKHKTNLNISFLIEKGDNEII